ncbi:MAG: hypothetical protein ACRDPA_03155, partial [Solirubrobacteraceae bacterium]
VDSSGNLWVANDNSNTVVAYASGQLGASGSPTPTVVISGPDLSGGPYALAFDATGDLWVANINSGTIVAFTRSELTATGTPVPAVTLGDSSQGFTAGPSGLAFDGAGNLWVANNVANTITEYPVSHLVTGGTPSVTISGKAIDWPEEIAFASDGSLWVANTAVDSGHGTIIGYASSALQASGSTAPGVTLKPPGGPNGTYVTGVAFDATGDLWYTELDGHTVGEYSTTQLTAFTGAAPAVAVRIPDSLAPVGLAFYPRAKRLPD